MAVPSYRKVSRKTLRQPDEFVTTVDWLGEWVARNLGRVIIAAAVSFVVIAIILAFSLYSQHRQRIASEQFYRAINSLSDKDYRAAEKGFSKLARHKAGSRLGRLAEFYLANTYLAQNQPAKASDTIRNYLAEGPNGMFRQMALVQLGVASEDLGNYQAAHAAYLNASQLNGPQKARAQIAAARTLAQMGDQRAAIAAYREFLRANPFAEQRPEVIEALSLLGASAEPPAIENGSPVVKGAPNTGAHP